MYARIAFIAAVLIALVAGEFALRSRRGDTPAGPLAGTGQLVLVLAASDSSPSGRLQSFSRTGRAWRRELDTPVVLGEYGLAWGRGLHGPQDLPPGVEMKREGDRRAPAGAFRLLHAYGYDPTERVHTRFPYTQATGTLICCDDSSAAGYNEVFDWRGRGLDPDHLPSHEDMHRADDLYRYIIVVGHNTWNTEPGAGSCIFLHVWAGPASSTAGCTAMPEKHIRRLLAWLDPDEMPVLVQLSMGDYLRLREAWGLPETGL